MKLTIKKWSAINDREVILNGESKLVFASTAATDQKLEAAYRALGVAYPKFFKMDAQSKLGWLSAEYLCEGVKLFDASVGKDVALVLSNRKSSLDTDEHYQQSLTNEEEFLPSPAVFVYTLANIVAGEICIRHGIKGENNFLISESFDAASLVNYVSILFEEELCQQCLVGWVEAYHGKLRSVFAFIEKTTEGKAGLLFTIENLNQVYQTSEL
ncbi:MAG: 3-oxoacyl-ACP synthase [Cytophagaceae bacterium]|nr:3-oxoacyl-ACP synthase [Cytophagaceae bacterium]